VFELDHSILEIIASYFIIVVGSSNEITNVSSSVEFLVSFNLEGLSLLSVFFRPCSSSMQPLGFSPLF
jgi:hypothetical protein